MAVNMEVAEASGVTSEDASSPGTPANESSPVEVPVDDARPTTSDGAAERDGEAASGDDPRAPQTPLAFTIDFGSSKAVDTARYQNLFERYNARHRRNLSTSKVLRILAMINLML